MSKNQNSLHWADYENKIDELLKQTRYYFSSDQDSQFNEKGSTAQQNSTLSKQIPQIRNPSANKQEQNLKRSPLKPAINIRKTMIRNVSRNPGVYPEMHSANMYSRKDVSAFPAKIWISIDESSDSKDREDSVGPRHSKRLRFAGQSTRREDSLISQEHAERDPHFASNIILETLRNSRSPPRRVPEKSKLEQLKEQVHHMKKMELQSVFSSGVGEPSESIDRNQVPSDFRNKRSSSPTTGWRSNYRVSDTQYYQFGYKNRSPSLLRNSPENTNRIMSKPGFEASLDFKSQVQAENSTLIFQSEDSPRCESPSPSYQRKLSPKQRLHPSIDADIFRSNYSRTDTRDQKKRIILKTTQSLNEDPDDMLLGYLGLKQNVKASRIKSAVKGIENVQKAMKHPQSAKNMFSLNPKRIIRPCHSQSIDNKSNDRFLDQSTDKQGPQSNHNNVVHLEKLDPAAIAHAIQNAKKKVSVLVPPTLTGSNTKFVLRGSISGRPRNNSVDFSSRGSKSRVSVINQLHYLPPQTGLSLLSEVLGHHKTERQNLVKSLQETEAAQLQTAFKLTEAFSAATNRYSPVDEYLQRMSKMGKLHASTQQYH